MANWCLVSSFLKASLVGKVCSVCSPSSVCASVGLGERPAFEIEDRRPVVRAASAASLHPEPEAKTSTESIVSFEPISSNIGVVLT